MHELPLLINIAMALVVAFVGGLIARRIGMPTIVGYLVAGIVIGPFTPGFVGDVDTIGQLAELGVIFLMFGVGLHFSFRDLWRVRDIAIPGALAQSVLAALAGVGLTHLWGWSLAASIVMGLAISVASTVVLLRGLMDHSLLNTSHGQAAVGWLVMEDILTVFILVLLPAFAPTQGGMDWANLGVTLAKSAAFVVVVAFAGRWLIPRVLDLIAHTNSSELFILAILTISLGTALGAAELFGVSLALGAFVAGAVVSESPLSHQVSANVLPFREAFAVLFFVSIGMLVNPGYLVQTIGSVLALTLLVVVGKFLIVLLLGPFFSRPAYTMLVIAAGLSQIGEFSFILGQAGLSLGMLSQDQYSLILAVALLSITVNPLMFRLIGPVQRLLQRAPALWRLLDRHGPAPAPIESCMTGHIVIVGYGRVGRHAVQVAEALNTPHLVIESDAARIDELNERGTATLYGDAANSEVLSHACLDRASMLVVAATEDFTNEMAVATARKLAPELPVIARAGTQDAVNRLAELGAGDIINPQLEGGLEIVRHILLRLGKSQRDASRYTDTVRRGHYKFLGDTDEEHRLLQYLLDAVNDFEIDWLRLDEGSPLIGQSLGHAGVRTRTGASIVALLRQGKVQANLPPSIVFQAGDRIGVVGDPHQIAAITELVTGGAPPLAPEQTSA